MIITLKASPFKMFELEHEQKLKINLIQLKYDHLLTTMVEFIQEKLHVLQSISHDLLLSDQLNLANVIIKLANLPLRFLFLI